MTCLNYIKETLFRAYQTNCNHLPNKNVNFLRSIASIVITWFKVLGHLKWYFQYNEPTQLHTQHMPTNVQSKNKINWNIFQMRAVILLFQIKCKWKHWSETNPIKNNDNYVELATCCVVSPYQNDCSRFCDKWTVLLFPLISIHFSFS